MAFRMGDEELIEESRRNAAALEREREKREEQERQAEQDRQAK